MTTKYTLQKAYTESSRGNIVFGGWDIMCGDNWCNRYWTRREAIAALALEGITLSK